MPSVDFGQRISEDLIKYWLGHVPETVTDEYSKLKDDVQFRQGWAEQVGLGFDLGQQEMFSSVLTTEVSQVV